MTREEIAEEQRRALDEWDDITTATNIDRLGASFRDRHPRETPWRKPAREACAKRSPAHRASDRVRETET